MKQEEFIRKAMEIAKQEAQREGIDTFAWGEARVYKKFYDKEIILDIKNSNGLMLVVHREGEDIRVSPSRMKNGRLEISDSYTVFI